jgi:hypothetical protein
VPRYRLDLQAGNKACFLLQENALLSACSQFGKVESVRMLREKGGTLLDAFETSNPEEELRSDAWKECSLLSQITTSTGFLATLSIPMHAG